MSPVFNGGTDENCPTGLAGDVGGDGLKERLMERTARYCSRGCRHGKPGSTSSTGWENIRESEFHPGLPGRSYWHTFWPRIRGLPRAGVSRNSIWFLCGSRTLEFRWKSFLVGRRQQTAAPGKLRRRSAASPACLLSYPHFLARKNTTSTGEEAMYAPSPVTRLWTSCYFGMY